MYREIFTFLGVVVTAVVSYSVAKKADKKEKEDLNVARTGQAIESWKDLAESNKDHWDECEVKCKELETTCRDLQQQIHEQNVTLVELKAEITIMKLQLTGRLQIDEKRNESNNQNDH